MSRRAVWPPRPHVHAASGQERVSWRGRHYYLGPAGSAQARQEYARLLAELAGSEPAPAPARRGDSPPSAPTIAQVAAAWRVHALRRYGAANPEVGNYDHALAVLLERYADLPAAQYDADRLEQTREDMMARGWCRNHINRLVVRLRTVWRWAERKKHVPAGTWSHLRTLTPLPARTSGVRDSKPVQPTTWESVQAVMACTNPRIRAMLAVQWWTGCRPSDARRMRAGEIERSGEVWWYRPPLHKTAWRGHERVVAIGPECRAVLAPHLEGLGPDDLVFPGRRPGKEYARRSYSQAVERACRRAGVRLHLYQLRHAAKQRLTRAYGLDTARAVLGQRSILVTDRYAAGQDQHLAEEAARKSG